MKQKYCEEAEAFKWNAYKSKIGLSVKAMLCGFSAKTANAANVEYAETQVLGLTTAQSRQT